MITRDMVPQLIGRQAYDRDGKKLGQVGQVYVDEHNGAPVWATVHTGLFGMTESFVPLATADVTDRDLALAVSKDEVKDAPRVEDSGAQLSADEESRLARYYGRWSGKDQRAGQAGGRAGEGHDRHAADSHDRSGRDATEGMTRSEERLRVGTESMETGKVRLRKYVVTEEQQVNVPVRHEEVRLEREPIKEGGRTGHHSIGEDEQQVTLHAERPVVDKQTEAVETVRLGTETVTEDQMVSDTVRKEQVDIDDPQNQLRQGGRDRRTTDR